MSSMSFMRARRLLLGVAFTFVLVTSMVDISLSQEEEVAIRLSVESKKREAILQWDKIATATDYRVERSDELSFERITVASDWITDTTYVFSNLEYDHTYYYRVGARVAGDTLWSETEQSYQPKPLGVRGFIDSVWYAFYFDFMGKGGWIMWVILVFLLGGVGLGLSRAHALRLSNLFPHNNLFVEKYKNDAQHKALFETLFKDKEVMPSFINRLVSVVNRERKREECFNMFIEAVQHYWGQINEAEEKQFNKEEKKAIEDAKALCDDNPEYPISRIFRTGLENHRSRESHVSFEIDRSIESAAANEREKLRKSLSHLWALASLAPMLGLLGTVIGVSEAFCELGLHTDLSFDERLPLLAVGIYKALYTTVFGLLTAIPLAGVYFYLRDKIDWIYTLWETDTFRLTAKI